MNDIVGQEIREEIATGIISGAVVAYGNACEETESVAFGHGDLDGSIPMRTDSVFDIASVSKVLGTVSAVMLCVQRGLLSLDAPFTEYIHFNAPFPGRVPTLHEMANHISGFSHAGRPDDPETGRQYASTYGWDIERKLYEFPPLFVPGVHYEYCCWNYMLLARVVEAVTGMPFISFCRKEIFLPLDMNETSFGSAAGSVASNRLTQSINTLRCGVVSDRWAQRLLSAGYASGHAGIMTTAQDLGKFCRALLNGGLGLFTKESIDLLTTPIAVDPNRSHSVGWLMKDPVLPGNASDKTIFHSGYTGHTVLIDFKKKFYGIVHTTRHDIYERAKKGRFDILATLLP